MLDLSPTTYVDSAGIHLLFRLGGALTRRRQQLRVVVPEGAPIKKLVNISGVTWTVPRDDTVEDSLARLRVEVQPLYDEAAWMSDPEDSSFY